MELRFIKYPKNEISIERKNGIYNLFIEKIIGYEIMDEFGEGSKPLHSFEGAQFSEFRSLIYYLIFHSDRKKESKIVELIGLINSEKKDVRNIVDCLNRKYKN